MKSKPKKSITICASASFFKQAVEIEEELKQLGFLVKLPYTAMKMRKANDFSVENFKPWLRDPKNYARKSWLTKNHFQKVISGDAILVLNYEKHGLTGYIGGATLMEMGVAFHNTKPIFILNPIAQDLSFKEEILGMQPVFLNGDLSKIIF